MFLIARIMARDLLAGESLVAVEQTAQRFPLTPPGTGRYPVS